MSKPLEWRFSRDGEWIAEVGCVECMVSSTRDNGWYFSCETQAEGLRGPEQAKDAAQDALVAMRDALVAHLAPVLRWSTNADDGRSEASVGPWRLVASEHDWTVRHLEGPIVADAGCSRPSSDESARRSAEDALRSLGVAFRTEAPR